MARLIEDLKKDHAEIAAMLEKVKDARTSHADALKILLNARASLLAHLRKEDLQLYPALNRAAEKDAALKKTVEFYAKDMEQITVEAISFFDAYSKPGASIDIQFAKDFGKLFATISRRLRSEESTLYREDERVSP